MSYDLKKILSALILIVGFFAFIMSTANNNFNLALIYLTSTLILWTSFGLLLDVFDIRFFAAIISISGFMVAIAVFFLFGIQEVPYPIGAIIFHLEGIAGALGISFFSFFPILVLYYADFNKNAVIKLPQGDQSEIVIDDDEWEMANEDDLQSGKFELG